MCSNHYSPSGCSIKGRTTSHGLWRMRSENSVFSVFNVPSVYAVRAFNVTFLFLFLKNLCAYHYGTRSRPSTHFSDYANKSELSQFSI